MLTPEKKAELDKRLAELSGIIFKEGEYYLFSCAEECSEIPTYTDSVDEMLEVCRKMGWYYDLRPVMETKIHYAYIDTDPLEGYGEIYSAEAPTPQEALAEALWKATGCDAEHA